MYTVPKEDALRRRRDEHSRWDKSYHRVAAIPVVPKIFPRFTFDPGATIFTIGSCFARNIERQLGRLGYNIPTLKLKIPHDEAETANGILNKYTPPAILQDLQWAQRVLADGGVTEANTGQFIQETADGSVFDNNLSGQTPVTRERFYQRRKEIAAVYSELEHAECVTITLGYIEAWFDKIRKIYLQSAPVNRYQSGDFEFRVLDYACSRDMVMQAIEILRQINPKIRVLLTTSPVPLGSTFAGGDVIVANMHSKSVLRAVCGDLYYAGIDAFDYFPSYEMVMMTKSSKIWAADLIHIPETTVEQIVAILAQHYFKQAPEAQAFNQSYVALRRGDAQEALHLARVAAERSPDDVECLAHLSYLLWKNGNRRKAEMVAKRAIEIKGDHPVGLFVLARVLESRGENAKALAIMREALAACMRREGSPIHGLNVAKMTKICARLATKLRRPQLATELLNARRSVPHDRSQSAISRLFGNGLYRRKPLAEAEHLLEEAGADSDLDGAPRDARAMSPLGL